MPPLRVIRHAPPGQELLTFAGNDTAYAVWLAKVEVLCDRFLNIEMMQLIESEDLDPYDDWKRCVRPERFFTDILIPIVEDGIDSLIDDIIGREATWGETQP